MAGYGWIRKGRGDEGLEKPAGWFPVWSAPQHDWAVSGGAVTGRGSKERMGQKPMWRNANRIETVHAPQKGGAKWRAKQEARAAWKNMWEEMP